MILSRWSVSAGILTGLCLSIAAMVALGSRAQAGSPPVTECVGVLLPVVYERGVSTPDEYAAAIGSASVPIPQGWTLAAGGGLTPLDGRPMVSAVICRQR